MTFISDINELQLGGPSESIFEKQASTLTGQVVVLILTTAAFVVLANSLKPADVGLYSLTVIIAQMLTVIALFGFPAVNLIYVERHGGENRSIVGNSFSFSIIWGSICLAILIFAGDQIPDTFLPKLGSQLWRMAFVAIIPLMLLELSHGFLLGISLTQRLNWVMIISGMLLVAGLWWFAEKGILSVIAAVGIWIITVVLAAAFQAISAWSIAGKSISVSPRLLMSMFPENIHSFVVDVISIFHYRFDFILIDHFLTHRDLGYYSIAALLVSFIWYLPNALARTVIRQFPSYHPHNKEDVSIRMARMTFTFAVVVTVLLGLSSWAMIYFLFGKVYLPAFSAMLSLFPGGLMISLGRVLSGDLIARGLRNYALMISTLGFLISLILYLHVNVNTTTG